jgi:hypothetical protein
LPIALALLRRWALKLGKIYQCFRSAGTISKLDPLAFWQYSFLNRKKGFNSLLQRYSIFMTQKDSKKHRKRQTS